MLDGSPDLVFLLGADGRFLFVNDTVKRPPGYGKEALLGEHYSLRGCADVVEGESDRINNCTPSLSVTLQ